MKKLLLITAATMLSASAYANCETACAPAVPCGTGKISPVSCAIPCVDSCTDNYGPYGTISGGLGWFNNIKHGFDLSRDLRVINNTGIPNTRVSPYTIKLKPKPKAAPMFQVGAGYRVNENVRLEGVLLGVFPKYKGVVENIIDNNAPNHLSNIRVRATQKSRIFALMAKALFDLPILPNFGLYAGPGIGVVQSKDKITKVYSGTNSITNVAFNNNSISSKSKTKYSPAYGLFLGTNIPFFDMGAGVTAFSELSLMYLGRPKDKFKDVLTNNPFKGRKNHQRAIGLSVGLRYGF